MISKELLSEVLDDRSIDFIDRELRNGKKVGYFSNRDKEKKYINIHELAHKCKSWAISKEYGMSVYTNTFGGCVVELDASFDIRDFHSKSEPEAIFASCQWILDQRKPNDPTT